MIGLQHQTLLPPRFSHDHQFCNHVVNFPLLHSYCYENWGSKFFRLEIYKKLFAKHFLKIFLITSTFTIYNTISLFTGAQ